MENKSSIWPSFPLLDELGELRLDELGELTLELDEFTEDGLEEDKEDELSELELTDRPKLVEEALDGEETEDKSSV